MSKKKEECELEYLVIPDEEQKHNEISPPLSVVSMSQASNKVSSTNGNEPTETRSLSRNTTAPSSQSGHHLLRIQHSNEKLPVRPSERPPRPPPPTVRSLSKRAISSTHVPLVPLVHHSFLSDVTDVRQMEHALLSLLDDFQRGKLRAFGKECSMEQMTGIREQQEHLARIHFELGAQQELFAPLSDEGLNRGTESMFSLMSRLEQLSMSIEKLHSFSSGVQD